VDISVKAAEKITGLLEAEEKGCSFRVAIEAGGCSGLQYVFSVEKKRWNAEDHRIHCGEYQLVVDPQSWEYLQAANTVLDYKEDLHSEGFVITNPKAVASCGCGTSFSIE
jgi:iron-sulfur cluster insertion protein